MQSRHWAPIDHGELLLKWVGQNLQVAASAGPLPQGQFSKLLRTTRNCVVHPHLKQMNRRDFTRGLASLGLLPAMPLPAAGAATTASTAATAMVDKMYFVGWYTARLNKTCSSDVLMSELRVDGETARAIFRKLVKNGTVGAPDALGVSQTVDPLRRTTRRLSRAATQTARASGKDPLRKTKRIIPEAGEKTAQAADSQNNLKVEAEPMVDLAADNAVEKQDAGPTDGVEVTPPTGTPQTRSAAAK